MSAKLLAAIFLIGHITALVVILHVLSRQFRIITQRPDSSLNSGRFVLFVLAAAIGLGNFIPIIVDSAVLLGAVTRANPTLIGVVYSLSNLLTLVLSASAVLALYIIAERLYNSTEE